MIRQSPHTITYRSLIAFMTEIENEATGKYEAAKRNGTVSMDPIVHRIECARKLKRMLQKCEPGQQADLFAMFEKTRP